MAITAPASIIAAFLLVSPAPQPAPHAVSAVASAPAPAPVHCQVPCGIYGDKLRIDLLMEDTATIEKAMKQIQEIGSADTPNWNQLVRWVNTKEEHAQKVQDQIGAYWMAQRIKAPKMDDGKVDRAKYMAYIDQLTAAHSIITSAMKCKQTSDPANAQALRAAITTLEGAYFTDEDRKHLQEHKGGGDHDHKDADHDHTHDKQASAHQHGEHEVATKTAR